MFQFPTSPNTLVTRQIECVACREIFAITEDIAALRPERSGFWAMLPDQLANIRQRFDPRIGHAPIIPEARAGTQAAPHPILNERRSQRAHVNCPRCGADNRNWLHIVNPPPDANSFGRDTWWMRFGMAAVGAVLALLFGIVATLLLSQVGENNLQTLSMLLFVVAGVLLQTVAITLLWRRQRRFNIERKLDKTKSPWKLSPTTEVNLSFFMLFAILLPLLIYAIMPMTLNRVRPRLLPPLPDRIDQVLVSLPQTFNSASREDLVLIENSVTALEAVISQRDFDCQAGTLTTMIRNLEALRAGSSQNDILLLNTINSLRALRDSGPECRPELLDDAILNLQLLLSICGGTGPALPTPRPPGSNLIPPTGKGPAGKRVSTSATQINPTPTPTPIPQICTNTTVLSNILFQLIALQETPKPSGTSLQDRAKSALERSRLIALTSSNQRELNLIAGQVAIFEQVAGISLPAPRPINLDAILIWVFVVGSATIVAGFSAMSAVQSFLARIEPHLPRPIGFSVADMTRIAIRDLRRSLDMADETLQEIQWTTIRRQPNGGILLKGMFLPPENLESQDVYIRTQCCEAWTDQWARILKADVQFCRIPRLEVYPGRRRVMVELAEVEQFDRLFRGRPVEPREGLPVR